MRDIRETARIGAWAAWWATVVVGSGAIVLWSGEAYPHQATPTAAQPEGWTYPIICCSLRDCRPALPGEVVEIDEGYTLVSTGEIILHGDKRIKEIAPDGLFHVCQQGGNFDTGRVLCLLIPPRAF